MLKYLRVYILIPSIVLLSGCETLSNEVIATIGSGVGCAILSKETGSSDRQAAIAAVVCASVGYAVTKEMEDRRKTYANNEQFYVAEQKRLSTYSNSLEGEIAIAKANLEAEELEVQRIIDGLQNSESDTNRLVEIRNSLESRKLSLNSALAEAEENRKYQRGLVEHMRASNTDTSEAESQLAMLESSVSELRGLVSATTNQSASLGRHL